MISSLLSLLWSEMIYAWNTSTNLCTNKIILIITVNEWRNSFYLHFRVTAKIIPSTETAEVNIFFHYIMIGLICKKIKNYIKAATLPLVSEKPRTFDKVHFILSWTVASTRLTTKTRSSALRDETGNQKIKLHLFTELLLRQTSASRCFIL